MLVALALTIIATDQPKNVDPKIVSASLFKNGYSVVSREFDVAGPGTYVIAKVPSGALGTLWFTTGQDTKLMKVEVTSVTNTDKRQVESLDGLYAANIGKRIRIGIRNGDKVVGDSQEGTLLSAGNEFLLLDSGSSTIMIPKSSVTSMASVGSTLTHETTLQSSSRVVLVQTSGKAGKVRMTSLESGLSWVPAYAIDISNPAKLSICGKATVLNDLADLKDVEARFVTGFPNMPFAAYLDPLIHGGTVQQFTDMLDGIGAPRPTGLFRGGRPAQSVYLSQNGLSQSEGSFASSMDYSSLSGSQVEDLFFYNMPHVSTKSGDRSYHILFESEARYTDIYTWSIADSTINGVEYRGLPDEPADVWHTLRFKNLSGQPFTTGVATIYKDNEIMGQDTMHYVSAGSSTDVKMTKALDIHAEVDEIELSRVRDIFKTVPRLPGYDLVTIEGKLQITNTKKSSVRMNISKVLTGEVVETAGDPKTTKTAKGLKAMNTVAKLEWDKTIPAGEVLKLRYVYKLYVRSQ